MKIAAGWDHRGRVFRERVKDAIETLGHEFVDMGAPDEAPSDYPDYAFRVGEAVRDGECDMGVLVCGSGIGVDIAANKVKGVRAATAHDVETARLSRSHNNANVLCLSEKTAASDVFPSILRTWFVTPPPTEGRHVRRVGKITAYEERRG